jgi:hypothetical protein
VIKGDNSTLQQMAGKVGIDWGSTRISGPGALDENEVSIEAGDLGGVHGPNAMTGDGYNGSMPGSSVKG